MDFLGYTPGSNHVNLDLALPLDAGQNSSHIVGRTPSVLKNVETKFSGSVYIGVEHLADEFDAGRLVGVLFLEVHHEAKCSILKGCVGRTNDHRIPIRCIREVFQVGWITFHLPSHHVISDRRGRDTGRGISLHPLRVTESQRLAGGKITRNKGP